MNVAAFFHIWADGAWREPLAEFQSALSRSQFDGPVYYVVVGSPDRAEWVEHGVIAGHWAKSGNESVTINDLRRYAHTHDGAILYAHTKGAHENTAFRARWRRSMTARVIERWRKNVQYLVDDNGDGCVDAVGCHWLTEAEYPGMFGAMTVPAEGSGFFGGNFWMARCDYLRTLPPCKPEPRWEAEQWIGVGHPRVVDLLPGWPDDRRWPELCV